jgi:hypothetical protein
VTGPRAEITLSDELVATIVTLVAERVVEHLSVSYSPPEPSPYVSIQEAAEFLRCGYDEDGNVKRQRVDDLLSRGALTRVKDGRRTLVLREELERHLARSTSPRMR